MAPVWIPCYDSTYLDFVFKNFIQNSSMTVLEINPARSDETKIINNVKIVQQQFIPSLVKYIPFQYSSFITKQILQILQLNSLSINFKTKMP